MKLIKHIISSAAVVGIMMAAAPAMADDNIDVIRITYTDGLTDYINVADINKISFTKGVDTESEAAEKVNDMFDLMKALWLVDSSSHSDFSYPSLMIGMDAQTPYNVSSYNGYDWFSAFAMYRNTSTAYVGYPNTRMWKYCYTYIAAANKVIILLPQPSTPEERLLAAQAYALRSFAYWNLVQTFAHNYYFAPNAQAVPIIPLDSNPFGTEETATFEAASTLEVYRMIIADINTAIEYLEDNTLTPAHIDTGRARRFVDLGTAYGLCARYHLTMHNYRVAYNYAHRAIENTSATPMLREVVAFPGFNNAKLNNWMWGITIDETDRAYTSGIVNFSSFVSTLSGGGYAGVGAFRACSETLHQYLENNPGDVRGNWFANEYYYSNLLTPAQNDILNDFKVFDLKYPNLKFAPFRNLVDYSRIAADVPLMRVEEMYLIEAEGRAMSGDLTGALHVLNSFVAGYRNPDYNFTAASATEFQEEIIRQRAIELWGEGLSYFDMLRLQLPLDTTTDSNYDWQYQHKFEGGSDAFKYTYPRMAPYVKDWEYNVSVDTPAPAKHIARKLK